MLISSDRSAELSHEYSTTSQDCNWRDNAFSEGHQSLMGAITAARTPLSAQTLETLHGARLRRYSPTRRIFLTGTNKPDEPIQPLHLSFRDFITPRARSSRFLHQRKGTGSLANGDIPDSMQTLYLPANSGQTTSWMSPDPSVDLIVALALNFCRVQVRIPG